MFTSFFLELRKAHLPVSMKEYLLLLEAVKQGLADYRVDDFYYLSRSALVKDERNLDKFDRVFGHVFKGLEMLSELFEPANIPEDWLRKMAELHLTEEEKAEIEAMGGWEKLMEELKKRLEEQKGRHQGGNKWIGTAGKSPYGAYGYNPEGVRIGQDGNRNFSAVKVWDKREFRNLDDSVELGTRNIKIALRKLRRFAREGAADELDLPDTIHSTARQGWLDIKMVPERHNAVKVLIFFDVGGSMSPHVKVCEELFSACKTEFKHLQYYYFHNCLYDYVWEDNRRRNSDPMQTWDVLPHLRQRLQGDLRRRRLDEPLRDRHAGRLGRILERGGRRGLAQPDHPDLHPLRLAEPGAPAALAVHALDRHDRRHFRAPHVRTDPPGAR